MSFVIATPELVQGAARDLAGVGSSLAETVAGAAGSTTGITSAAQDEVSRAIASVFGDFGDQFQALSARAQSFHSEFVRTMTASAGAYLGAESAGVSQMVQAEMQGISALAGAPTMINNLGDFAAAVAGPYQALISNTGSNLQAIANNITQTSQPFLQTIGFNEQVFVQEITATIQNLPTELANLPTAVQGAIQGLSTGNLLPPGFIDAEGNAGQIIAHALNASAQDFVTGVQALPSAFNTGLQQLLRGDFTGGVGTIGLGVGHVFFDGFAPTGDFEFVNVRGALGELLIIPPTATAMVAGIPELLLPTGSAAQVLAQNFAGLLALPTLVNPELFLGIPEIPPQLALLFDAAGAPLSAMNAGGTSLAAFADAMQTGNVAGAAAAVLDAPAVIANGFLNGSAVLSLPPITITEGGAVISSVSLQLPVGGLLAPVVQPSPFSTGTGGFVQGLLDTVGEIASEIA
jgi:PE family